MNYQTHFEKHFHDENHASVLINTDADGSEKDFCEILLFCYLATRQMNNLKGNKISISLAEILSNTNSSSGDYSDYWQLMSKLKTESDIPYYVPFIAAIGVDVSELVGLIPSLGIYRARNNLSKQQVARQICPNVAQVKEYRGSDGKKQFIASMELRDKSVISFDLQHKGFGILGKGVNYYAPMSVILTFKYLSSLHADWEPENSGFRKMLIKAANLCGTAFLMNKITAVNQGSLPLEIVNQVFSSQS